MKDRDGTLLDEIKQRRKTTVEIILVAVILGVAINTFSTVLFEKIKVFVSMWHVALFLMSLILLILFYVLNKKISEYSEFRIMLPLKKDGDKFIVPIKGYAPSEYSIEILNNYFKKHPNAICKCQAELKDFLENRTIQASSLISKFIVFLHFGLIKEFGKRVLTTSSLYHEKYRHLSWQFKSYTIRKESLPASLKENEFVTGSLRLPQDIVLKSVGGNSEKIILDSPLAALLIEILPNWSTLTIKNNRRTYKIAMRNLTDTDDIVLLTVPIRCKIFVRQWKVFFKRTEAIYEWMSALKSDFIQWLSWDRYVQEDTERLLVDVYQKIHNIS